MFITAQGLSLGQLACNTVILVQKTGFFIITEGLIIAESFLEAGDGDLSIV